jgi:hypothetical protein
MNGFFGALGIFFAFAIGGRLFDAFAPSAPFLMAGAVQLVLCVLALLVRIAAPGDGQSAEPSA